MSSLFGRVDGLQGAYVVGWAAPAEDGSNRRITICDENGRRLASARAARYRADLASLGLPTADFAFRIPILKPLGMERLHILSDGVELPGSPLEMGPGQIDGDVEIEGDTLSGWVLPRAPDTEPAPVTVTDPDGRTVGTARTTAPLGGDPLFAPWRFRVRLDQSCFGHEALALTCRMGQLEIGRVLVSIAVTGMLEILTPQRVVGWLRSPAAPGRRFTLEISRDGEPPVRAGCEVQRPDVREAFPDLPDARVGFDVALPPIDDPARLARLSIRLAGSTHELFEGPHVAGSRPALVRAARRVAGLVHENASLLGPETVSMLGALLAGMVAEQRRASDGRHVRLAAGTRAEGDPDITVVIPIYRDVAVTRACIESVLATRDPARHRILAIDDRSPDADMAPMLAGYDGVPNVVVRRNDTNRGFIGSVNRALRDEACRGDVILLNSDTRAFAGWLDELAAVASASPVIGTVTALSNNATIFSYPHMSLREEPIADIDLERLAALALARNRGVAIDVPTGHGFCLFIKREVVDQVGLLDETFGRGYGEENDFCARAGDLGYRHVAAAGVLVEHRESVSFSGDKTELLARNMRILEERYPEYSPTVIAFEREDGLRSARWPLDEERLRRHAGSGYVVTVAIANFLGGGTVKAMEETRDAGGLDAFPAIEVRARADGFIEFTCPAPAVRAIFAPDETAILFAMLARLPVRLLVVHQTLGFGADFIDGLREAALRVRAVFYAHDFYPLCPRVTMIDATGAFCDVADPSVCARCVAMGGAHEASNLPTTETAIHRARYQTLLSAFDRIVAPSHSAAAYYRRAFEGVEPVAIYHPEDLRAVPAAPRRGTATDILILGAIGPHKGSRALLEIARHAMISDPAVVFHVIGHTDIDDALSEVGNVSITGPYRPAEMPHLIAGARGRFALFLQGWPETYSYTLSEAIAAGLIPLVPDIGAPAERVRATGFGHVFPFPIRAPEVMQLIGELARGERAPWNEAHGPRGHVALSDTAEATRVALLGGTNWSRSAKPDPDVAVSAEAS